MACISNPKACHNKKQKLALDCNPNEIYILYVAYQEILFGLSFHGKNKNSAAALVCRSSAAALVCRSSAAALDCRREFHV